MTDRQPAAHRRIPWALLALLLATNGRATAADAPDFTSEVRPILANHCFKCHGPDEVARKGKLRLDLRASGIAPAKSGEIAIVPGKPQASELVKRIHSTDEDEVMPPPATKKPLSAAEQEVLTRWIAAGAEYRPHWAFVPPVQAPLPAVQRTDWARNPIDRFVLARLEHAGLQPSPPAERLALARRASLDLIGLPPTPEEAGAFAADTAPDAYDRYVDHLLAQPQYGERWARKWLDLARYADTNGFEKDRPRSLWPWRDWVIGALNADMPFDRFTILQLAGDLVPGAGQDGQIATGFNRNTMINEEGGIDPQEYRFYAMVDRVATLGKTWLGLTTGCAQCHTHKYDPLTQREYYQLMAFMDNAEEPLLHLQPADIVQRRAAADARIATLVAALPEQFPVDRAIAWLPDQAMTVTAVSTESGERAERQPDGTWRMAGPAAERDVYTIAIDVDGACDAVRLEALPRPDQPRGGPGRAASGNFVVSALRVEAGPRGGALAPVKVESASADFSQTGYAVSAALAGDPKGGWGVDGSPHMDEARRAEFILKDGIDHAGGSRVVVRIEQRYGGQHTLGRFRLTLGRRAGGDESPAGRRVLAERAAAQWAERESAKAVRWTVLRPTTMTGGVPDLDLQGDGSVLASGDMTKSDTYHLVFHPADRAALRGATALRLEVIPDPRLPGGGPGRVWYEGTPGDFGLSELRASADGAPLNFARAMQSFAADGKGAAQAIDGRPDSFWSVSGGEGRYQTAVFVFSQPLGDQAELTLDLLNERYFACGLGRFRFSVTSAPAPTEASAQPPEVQDALLVAVGQRSATQHALLYQRWLETAPELAGARAPIDHERAQLAGGATTLVMQERSAHPRATFMHHRGEWLQPTERVSAGMPAFLPALPAGAPRDRLALARWLVDRGNPLTARVTVNRQWAAFFGRGLVRSVDDFGYQGDSPTDPALLDWLAVEFMERGWSLKALHRLIVTSATYQQASRIPPTLLARDPANLLLARAPRVRLEAEAIRDSVLRAAGLLSAKVGGPSVFPPQPASISQEGAYGALAWNTSAGEDRYRRGLYTFAKRTAPYALASTFDAPSGEVCIAQRDVSNSPLQALAMLNDPVFVEAAQALGKVLAARPGTPAERVDVLFRRCLTRPPAADEAALALRFLNDLRGRIERHEVDAGALCGEKSGEAAALAERALWTALARSILNLDEAITKG